MNVLSYLLLGFMLPLFPFSMLFNVLYARLPSTVVRIILLLLWPQAGLLLINSFSALPAPHWLAQLAMFTAALYAFRAIAARELGQWSGYLATSLWALLWVFLADTDTPLSSLQLHALGFSLPLVLLAMLGNSIESRFGAAYTGLYGGLAQSMPRLSGLLVLVVLATIATPLFPAFFSVTQLVFVEIAVAPWLAFGLLLVWLFWSWSGIRLLQGMIIGPAEQGSAMRDIQDLSLPVTWLYTLLLLGLAAESILIMGGW